MKAIKQLLPIMVVAATLLTSVRAVEPNLIADEFSRVHQNQVNFMSHFLYQMEVAAEYYIEMIMPQEYYAYKAKHDRSTPLVTSFKTQLKNNCILATSIGITMSCYYLAGIPLALNNDAGAFFTDCMTMWTMYVFFYEDERAIDYQLYGG